MNSLHKKLGMLALALLMGCMGPGAPSGDDSSVSTNPGDISSPIQGDEGQWGHCWSPFTKEVDAIDVHGEHLVFRIMDFAFLLDLRYRVEDVELIVDHAGKTHGDDDDFDVSFNGFRGSCGERYYSTEYRSDRDESHSRFKIKKLKLNGDESFLPYLSRILLKKGTVDIGLKGKYVHNILSAKVVFSGKHFGDCGGPSPSPTPAPLPSPEPSPSPSPIVAPTTSITGVDPSAAITSSTTISISFNSDQLGVQFNCSLDGSVPELCSSPVVYSGLASGEHAFKVVATNSAGLSDQSGASYAWAVDTVAPSVQIDNLAFLSSVTSSSSVAFNLSSNESGGSFLCSLDGSAFTVCEAAVSYSGLAEGSHRFQAIFQDAAGNLSDAPAQYQWMIDQTAPTASITSVDPAGDFIGVDSRTISFGASESATFECSVDGGPFSACSSPITLANLGEGSHQFAARATDLAGNQGSSATDSWSVDLTAPVIALGNVVPAQGSTNSGQVSVEFSASEVASFSCSLDGAPASDCSSPFVSSIASDGDHSLVISAQDQAGNAASPVTVSWTMDFSAPVISFGEILPSANANIGSSSLSLAVNSSEAITLSASLDGVDLGAVSSPIALDNLAEGPHHLVVSGVDNVGNASNSISHDFAVDLTSPAISLASAQVGTVADSTNSLSFSADEQAQFECDFDGAGYSACQSPHSLSGLADGSHVFSVRATDLAGNSSSASASWSVDTSAPLVSLSVSTAVNSSTATFNFSANEAVSGYECSVDGGAFSACSSPASQGGLGNGSHHVTVQATDLAGNVGSATQGFSIVVDSTPPEVSNIAKSATSTSILVTWTTNEPATDKVIANTKSTLESSVFVTGHSVRIAGLVPGTTYNLTVTGRDSAGNVYSVSAGQMRTP